MSSATTSVGRRSIEDILALGPVIPVLTVHDVASAVQTAHAIVRGGLSAIEVTLRTPVALAAIAAIGREVRGAVAGAGTVLAAEQLESAARAGAAFAVSPGSTATLRHAARDTTLPFLPGVATASEIMAGLEVGFRSFKLFPAAEVGMPLLRAFAGPFARARFCPTGGIDPDTARDWLALPNVACVGGSWIAPPALVAARQWDAIEERARRARALRPA